jgi:tripartite-type tricarboxylate transporter receptor subunit TctC
MRKIVSLFAAAMAALTATIAVPVGTGAQEAYPTRPITLVVPFPPGGPLDSLARILAGAMTPDLGQQVIVENVAGAGGTIGSGRVARAEADGYTLLGGHAGTLAANVSLYKKLRYDAVEDFEPIGFMGDVPQILIVRKDFPAQTAGEFFEYVREHQADLTCGTGGVGSAPHLGGLLLNAALGTDVRLVNYKGAAPAMTDLIGGHIDYMIDASTTVVPQVKAGTVRPLAVLSGQRIAALPDVPTMAEAGLENMEADIWHVLLAPKGTPKPVVDRLGTALRTALQDGSVRERLAELGIQPPNPDENTMTSEDISAFIHAEIERWRPVIQAAGVSAD